MVTFRGFCMQWLGISRADDPPVPCGHRVSFVLLERFDMNPQWSELVSRSAAPNQSSNLLLSGRYNWGLILRHFPQKPAISFNERFMAARHEDRLLLSQGLHIFSCLQWTIEQ